MSFKVMSVSDEGFDVRLVLLEKSFFGTDKGLRRFYGSGSTWWETVKDRFGSDKEERCNSWTSSQLHEIWRTYMNEKTAKKP